MGKAIIRRKPGTIQRGGRNKPVPAPILVLPSRRKRHPPVIPPRWETPLPRGVVGSYGPEVGRFAFRTLGLDLTAWQQHVLDRMLVYGRGGDLLTRLALVSTARQNGKTVVVRALIGWMLREGRKYAAFAEWSSILSCAHDAGQARIVYNQVLADAGGSDLNLTRLVGLRTADEKLVYDVATAQPGSKRGTSNGLLTWDEVLTSKTFDLYEALRPTQAAQRSPLLLMTSTAGYQDSVVLRRFYDRLVRIAAGDEAADPTFYGAWWQSEDPDAGLDWEQIAMANPGLREKRPTKAALVEAHTLMDPTGWSREHLNHWQLTHAGTAFRPGVWSSCRLPDPLEGVPEPFALGIGIAPGWARATLAVAARRDDGRIGVEVYREFRADVVPQQITAAIEEFSAERWPQTIAYDASSGGAGEFERHHQATAYPYDPLGPAQVMAAQMDTSEMIMAGVLAVDDPLVDAQVAYLARRNVGVDGRFRWDRAGSGGPIDAVEAVSMAAHAIAYAGRVTIY